MGFEIIVKMIFSTSETSPFLRITSFLSDCLAMPYSIMLIHGSKPSRDRRISFKIPGKAEAATLRIVPRQVPPAVYLLITLTYRVPRHRDQ